MIVDCQAGHEGHETMFVDTDIGKMEIYNWEQYFGNGGKYCPGQDDVSRTIFQTGNWARDETNLIRPILEKPASKKRRLVLDFGAHIGWYTIMAAKMGFDVVAFEAQPDHLLLLERNLLLNKVDGKVFVEPTWVDETMPKAKLNSGDSNYYKEIWFVKIDLEGNERYAIDSLDDLLKEKRIANLFMEVSPVFNDSYPELVERITSYGYDAIENGKTFDGNWDFDQSDILFRRQD